MIVAPHCFPHNTIERSIMQLPVLIVCFLSTGQGGTKEQLEDFMKKICTNDCSTIIAGDHTYYTSSSDPYIAFGCL